MCDCADQIERAATKGHPGLAEYLAERCDRRHGRTAHPHGDHDDQGAVGRGGDVETTEPEEGVA